MREDAFRAFLAPRLGDAGVTSHVASASPSERLLGAAPDRVDRDDGALTTIAGHLIGQDIAATSVRNVASLPRRGAERKAINRGSPIGDRPVESAASADVAGDGGARPHETDRPSPRWRTTEATTSELMRPCGAILAELQDRGVVGTADGWRLMVPDQLWSAPGGIDATAALGAAAA